ncbi:DUF2087 domain-containing protein [Paenibacillus sp. YPG26]|uniref:DUF2087 domain-containing protein n=1 Tax=Paenibacillus sp. YPG26 TaxID=2878915 RepID=UPI00203D0EF7|nr:DUF2087 domain-containing protein [Paenibacillus sp. YPG26]USB33583.1 DUF2087 domain-containing protein [Paenibacillus sp. YPG26]
MIDSELIWNASLSELERGYMEKDDLYICICCGKSFEKGIIYPEDDVLYETKKYVRLHIEKKHGSAFEYLISLDKSFTGLSEIQSNLLKLFYQGKSDKEVQQELGSGSTSTIRNHRFVLKEKERQARVFLAIMELLRAKDKHAPAVLKVQAGGSKDERYRITETEKDKVLAKYFPSGTRGPLKSFSMREKQKLIILNELSKRFEPDRIYSEKEVNEILSAAFEDYALLRRYLIEYGFMNRQPDGSEYWLAGPAAEQEGNAVDRRQELKLMAKEVKTQAGVFQIRNTKNGKLYVDSTPNLKTINGQEFSLEMGSHMCKSLQQEWSEMGKENFVIEVLETVKEKEGVQLDIKDTLKKLKEKWLKELQPFGDRGYN